MNLNLNQPVPVLTGLPVSLPREGAIERWQYVRFTIDHIVPVSEGGEEVALFNPRQHRWSEHFIWSDDGLRIIPLTATGDVTIKTLDLNRQRILNIRMADVMVERHPPTSDPIQRP